MKTVFLSLSLILILSGCELQNNDLKIISREIVNNPANEITTTTTTTTKNNIPNIENCAKQGERPTNFDLRTGKTVPGGKACCPGLVSIDEKSLQKDGSGKEICAMHQGIMGICRPCGDGICNHDYEDKCNCGQDCK